MTDRDFLLRELNHRVKNNFQIIVSLMNLKMRVMPPDRRADIRFLQEHVQLMAVAFRLVYATGEIGEVTVGELLTEVTAELRQIVRVGVDQVRLTGTDLHETVGLDQAIALSLCLAVVLPPFMDRARLSGTGVTVSALAEARLLTLSISGSRGLPVEPDMLRDRLTKAYLRQLNGEALPQADPSDLRFRVPLGSHR